MRGITTTTLAGICALLVTTVFAQQGNADSPAEAEKPHGKDHTSSLHSLPGAKPVVMPPAYQQAVKNAVEATEQNVSKNLIAILRGNGKLTWRQTGDQWQLLVATWTTHESYFPKPGTTFKENYTVWVTAAPQLKNFCSAYDPAKAGKPLARRLEQLLGLPPNSGHKYVVELWVNPDDLFRPSADPEVSDYEAQLKFPEVRGFVAVSSDYKGWYKDTAAARYKPATGPAYPWTRLGYTYDWGNPDSRVGLSEFVVRKGSELTVHSVSTTEDYGKGEPE